VRRRRADTTCTGSPDKRSLTDRRARKQRQSTGAPQASPPDPEKPPSSQGVCDGSASVGEDRRGHWREQGHRAGGDAGPGRRGRERRGRLTGTHRRAVHTGRRPPGASDVGGLDHAGRPGPASGRGDLGLRRSRHSGQQRRRRPAPDRWVPVSHRPGLDLHTDGQLPRRSPDHPGGAAAPGRPRRRQHRHHRLGQRGAARPARYRLQRRQGGIGQLLQGAIQRSRPAGCTRQHGESRTGCHRAVASRRRRRRDRRARHRWHPGRCRQAGRRRLGDRPVHPTTGGR
jgi:hypothetical protein